MGQLIQLIPKHPIKVRFSKMKHHIYRKLDTNYYDNFHKNTLIFESTSPSSLLILILFFSFADLHVLIKTSCFLARKECDTLEKSSDY